MIQISVTELDLTPEQIALDRERLESLAELLSEETDAAPIA